MFLSIRSEKRKRLIKEMKSVCVCVPGYSGDVTDWSNEWGGRRIVIRSAMLPSGLDHFSVIILCDLYAEKASTALPKQIHNMSQSFNFP